MCKEVKIEYKCDRCGKTIIEEKNPKFGFNIVGNYPKEFKKIHKNYLCQNCQNQYQALWKQFIEQPHGGKR